MTILEAIEAANELRAGNRVSDDTKRRWLYQLDLKIFNEVIATHTQTEAVSPKDYTKTTDCDLLIPDIDSEVYVWYLIAQIDSATGESDRYNTSAERFNSLYTAFTKRYNREHTPINNLRVRNAMKVGGI